MRLTPFLASVLAVRGAALNQTLRGQGDPFAELRAMLFGAGEVGVMYDLSDLTTQFQDAAGTTAVTANGQVEGLWLDKSKGLVLGSELITNAADREFTSDTGYWSKTQATISGGVATVTSPDGTTASLLKIGLTTAGVFYHLEFDLVIRTGSCRVADSTGTGYAVFYTSGRKTLNFFATGATTLGFVRSSGITDFDIDNVTIKTLAGNHATQATTASKPLSATNSADFDGLDDKMLQSAGGGSTTAFMLCAGLVLDGVGTVQTIWSDAGTNTGYAVRVNASNQLEILAGDGTAYTTCATTDTVAAGTPFVATVRDDGTNLHAQINNGTVVSVARPVVAAGTSTATIGSSNAATANVLNGKPFQIIQTKNDAGTDAEVAATKSYIASKIGVTL